MDDNRPPNLAGNSTLGDAHALDRIRVEHAEKPKQVVHAVQRHAVEQHEVLVGRSAANVEATCAFSSALDAWQQLQRLEQVDFATDGGKRFDLVDGDLHFGHLHLLLDAVFSFARHHRFFEGQARLKFEVQFEVLRGEVNLKPLWRVPEVADADFVDLNRQGERVESVDVGGHTLRHRFSPNRGANQGFAGCGVCDVAAEGVTF